MYGAGHVRNERFRYGLLFDLSKQEGERRVKKAMLAVSFGTTHDDAEASCIRPVEEALRHAFPEWSVYRAWTSRLIQKRLWERGVQVENETEALARLCVAGYDEIAVISTHIIPGQEY